MTTLNSAIVFEDFENDFSVDNKDNNYLQKEMSKLDGFTIGDTEFQNKIKLPDTFDNYSDLKKTICQTIFGVVQIARPHESVTVYEHPDVGLNLLPSWKGNCVLTHHYGYNEVPKPSGKVKTFDIGYGYYYSTFDIFGLFRDKDTQFKIARELIGGRVTRTKAFPNNLKTGVYFEYPTIDNSGNDIIEIRELAIKLYDFNGYTPAGVAGLDKTFETWGVKFENKGWKSYFDITKFVDEYSNTVDLVKVYLKDDSPVPLKDGEPTIKDCEVKWMSKHDICVQYASGDGVKEMIDLYNNVHTQGRLTLDKMGYESYNLKNFQTIGNLANQVGVARCLSALGLGVAKEDETQLAKYLYTSSAYSLLDECYTTVNQVLNVDGGFCKNMKPTYPVIKDLTLDMDLAGAYAESMKSLPYCVGIPSVISYPKDRDYRANFFEEYKKLSKKDFLYPGAWVARVSTKELLTFKQDLIFSKVFGKTDFEKNEQEDDEGFYEIDSNVMTSLNEKGLLARVPDGAFQMLSNEIISGILTSDIMQFITTYWSKSEQKELFSKLQIECLVFYNKKFLLSAEEFKSEFSKLDNTLAFNFDKGTTIKDKRKPIWTIIPTNKGWFGDLTNIRNQLKFYGALAKSILNPSNVSDEQLKEIHCKVSNIIATVKLDTSDLQTLNRLLYIIENYQLISDENIDELNIIASKYKCEQNGFKGVNNSSYGVTGSLLWQTEKPIETTKKDGTKVSFGRPKIGNIVFAQNVTARVRLGAYCMDKGLNGYSIITDGAQFNLNQVWDWNWKGLTGSYFGCQELWNLSRYNKSIQVDPSRYFKVSLQPLGNDGEWKLVGLEGKKVVISNNSITIKGNEENWGELDDIAYNHVKSKFIELDIFQGDVMKYASKDLYKGAAFQSQANYMFETFFEKKDLLGNTSNKKIKARGYGLNKCVFKSPDLSDDKLIHPYESMISDIYFKDEANVYITTVFSHQLLGVNDFNKTEKSANDYMSRGFLPHAPTYRSSKPSPFSLSMFKWNNRKQYELWDKKVESWKSKTGFGVELLFLTEEMVKDRVNLCYSEVVGKLQDMIDENISLNTLDKRVADKLSVIRHPQKLIEENLCCEVA